MFCCSILFQPNLANLQPVAAFISTVGIPHHVDHRQHSLLTTSHNPMFMRSSKDLWKWPLYNINKWDVVWIGCHWPAHRAGLLWSNFFGQPGSVSKFPPFLWVKLWVGRGYTEISRYFPHRGLIGLLSSQRYNFCIHWDFRSPFNHQKCLYGMILFASQSLILCAVYHSSPSSHVRSSLIGWLFILDYPCGWKVRLQCVLEYQTWSG